MAGGKTQTGRVAVGPRAHDATREREALEALLPPATHTGGCTTPRKQCADAQVSPDPSSALFSSVTGALIKLAGVSRPPTTGGSVNVATMKDLAAIAATYHNVLEKLCVKTKNRSRYLDGMSQEEHAEQYTRLLGLKAIWHDVMRFCANMQKIT